MPNRIIKESICRSDSIDSLSWFEEVLFYRLIVVCDDYGRFDGRPAIIRGSCFPLKDMRLEQIENALKGLTVAGMIRRYETEDGAFLQLTAWSKHQQTRATKSKYPDPDGNAKNQSPDRSDTGFCNQNESSGILCNQMISSDIKCPRNRESINDKRESRIENARAIGEVRRFEDFWSAYPLDKSRAAAEKAYCDVLLDGIYNEDDLVSAAKNYAEYCKITKTDKVYHACNFLSKAAFEDYIPGKYKSPKAAKAKNAFNDFDQRTYDWDALEKNLLTSSLKGADNPLTRH